MSKERTKKWRKNTLDRLPLRIKARSAACRANGFPSSAERGSERERERIYSESGIVVTAGGELVECLRNNEADMRVVCECAPSMEVRRPSSPEGSSQLASSGGFSYSQHQN